MKTYRLDEVVSGSDSRRPSAWRLLAIPFLALAYLLGSGTPANADANTADSKNGKGFVVREIKPGDTYWKFHREFGVSVDAIVEANPGVDHTDLQLGSTVKIPCGGETAQPVVKAEPKKKKISVDAGHGGKGVPGTHGTYNKKTHYEKDVALDYASCLTAKLKKAKYEVLQTRVSDKDVSFIARSKNTKNNNTISVSIHFNGVDDKSVSGAEVIYENNAERTKPLAELIMKYLYPIMGVHATSGQYKDGVKTPTDLGRGTLHMTREPNCGVIVEPGFMTNSGDMTRIMTKKTEIVNAIYRGITEYLASQN